MQVTPVGGTTPRAMPMNGAALTTSAPNTGNAILKDSLHCTYQVISAAAATVIIEGSNDSTNWAPVTGASGTSTITLAGAGTGAIVEPAAAAWRWVRARTTAATTATTALMGV